MPCTTISISHGSQRTTKREVTYRAAIAGARRPAVAGARSTAAVTLHIDVDVGVGFVLVWLVEMNIVL